MSNQILIKNSPDDFIDEVKKNYGLAFSQLATLYVQPLMDLDIAQLGQFVGFLFNRESFDKAIDIIHKKMTDEQLVEEKKKLALLTREIANKRVLSKQIIDAFLNKTLQAALSAILFPVMTLGEIETSGDTNGQD